MGCGSNNFWDQDPFFERLPNIPVPNTIADADKIGAIAAGAAIAGVVAHGAMSVVQKKKREAKEQHSVGGPQA